MVVFDCDVVVGESLDGEIGDACEDGENVALADESPEAEMTPAVADAMFEMDKNVVEK